MTLVSAVACCLLLSLGTATQPLMQRWNDVYKHLNSKTPYTAEQQGEGEDAERELRALLSDGRQGAPDTGTCDEVALYGVLRHGSRYPQRKQVAKLEKLRERLRFSAAAQQDPDLAWLRRWDPSELYPANEDGTLHASGRAELRGLAGRLQARYPRLLPAVSPGPTLAVRATAKPRAQQSARAFVAGLRGGANADQHEQDEDGTVEHDPMDADRVLRFFDVCPLYQAAVRRNSSMVAAEGGDIEALVLGAVSRRLQQRLAARGVTLLSQQQGQQGEGGGSSGGGAVPAAVDYAAAKAVWTACQYEALWHGGGASPIPVDTPHTIHTVPPSSSSGGGWCTLLAPEDVMALEAMGDVEGYWQKGPAVQLSSNMACELLQHAAARLSAVVAAGGVAAAAPNATTLQFAHAETVVPLLGLLGIGTNTAPLTLPKDVAGKSKRGADDTVIADTLRQLGERTWRLSELSPMAANVVLLLRMCKGAHTDGPMLTVLHNERAVRQARCGGRFHCPWAQWLAAFETELQHCNLDTLCRLPPPLRPSRDRFVMAVMVCLSCVTSVMLWSLGSSFKGDRAKQS